MPKLRRLDKLPRRKVTVDDLLDRNDLVDALDDLVEEKGNMDEFIGLWITDGTIYWSTSPMTKARMNYLLDMCKTSLLEDK